MTGIITDIITFSVYDGPGIRTTVFLKGCPLHCLWCHNPETQMERPQASRMVHLCVHCGACAAACPEGIRGADGSMRNAPRCIGCGACVRACPRKAISIVGREVSAEEVVRILAKDRPFYDNSGGGVTLSGGEPLLQHAFAFEILEGCRRLGIHTAVDTSGFCPPSVMRRAAEAADLFLFDLKETDPARHKAYTGVDPELIWSNLALLSQMGKDVILRCPVIPGLNDRPDHFAEIARRVKSMPNIKYAELLPYHKTGLSKARQIDFAQEAFRVPTQAEADGWADAVRAAGCDNVRAGKIS